MSAVDEIADARRAVAAASADYINAYIERWPTSPLAKEQRGERWLMSDSHAVSEETPHPG